MNSQIGSPSVSLNSRRIMSNPLPLGEGRVRVYEKSFMELLCSRWSAKPAATGRLHQQYIARCRFQLRDTAKFDDRAIRPNQKILANRTRLAASHAIWRML